MKKVITIAFILTVVPLLVFGQTKTTTTGPSATPTPEAATPTTPKGKRSILIV